jgi:hypothetical protein
MQSITQGVWRWIPAYAGMTEGEAGMTEEGAGIVGVSLSLTP